MSIFAKLEVCFSILFFFSIFIGYIVCHFIAAPILLRKHGKKGIYEAIVWEALHAENHLKALANETTDRVVITTLRIIKYSKYTILFSFILFFLFGFLDHMY
jgi:hypothetical protein